MTVPVPLAIHRNHCACACINLGMPPTHSYVHLLLKLELTYFSHLKRRLDLNLNPRVYHKSNALMFIALPLALHRHHWGCACINMSYVPTHTSMFTYVTASLLKLELT
jgi:hypothetical protein